MHGTQYRVKLLQRFLKMYLFFFKGYVKEFSNKL